MEQSCPLQKTLFNLLIFKILSLLSPRRLYVLWGFVVVTTSVTKAAKRKVSHQLIICEIHRQQDYYRGVKDQDN